MRHSPVHAGLLHRASDAVTRRGSLRALAGAALAATGAALPERATARKKKRKGKTCQDRERQRCTIDADACRATARDKCPELGLCDYVLICCDACTATGFFRCALIGA